MHQTEQALTRLLEIVSRLRGPNGCPWDQQQTPQTFKSYLIEEAHELLEAVDADDPDQIREELGDLFFQIVFLARLYEEKQQLTIADALRTISEKMVRRHPHVFGDVEAGSQEEMRQRWQEIKAREKAGQTKPADLLSAVPKSLPALRRAQRVTERALRRSGSDRDLRAALTEVDQGSEQLKKTVLAGAPGPIREALGNLLFTLANLGRLTATNAEDALQAAVDQFIENRRQQAGVPQEAEQISGPRQGGAGETAAAGKNN